MKFPGMPRKACRGCLLLLPVLLLTVLHARADEGTVQWSLETGGFVHATPAVGSDGTIYIGSYDSKLYAVNPDGTLLWTFETGGELHSSPVVGSDGTIYFGSRDMDFYAVNSDGSLKWQYTTGGEVNSSPAVGDDETIYFGSNDGYFYALNADGTLQWQFKTIDSQAVQSSPAIGPDQTIYFGSDEMRLYALDPDGTEKWHFKAGSMIRSSPAIASDGTVYVGSYDNMLYAIGSDGNKVWAYKTGGPVHSSPAIGADGTIYAGSHDHNLYAMNSDGSLKWAFTTQDVVFSSPAVGSDGMVYIASQDSNLYALNSDGSGKWYLGTGDLIRSSPVIGPSGVIYVGSRDARLYGVETTSIPDTTPPEVRLTDPESDAVDVSLNAVITATFSEALDASTMTVDTFQVNDGAENIQGTVSGSGASFTFTPESALTADTEYTVTLTSDIEDLSGNSLAESYIWRFTTLDDTTSDLCPDDPLKDDPGVCGCGVSDEDSDDDQVLDCNDDCPLDADKTVPGECGCGISDVDSDNDQVPDCNDDCPLDAAKQSPGECGCGNAETDTDGDDTLDCTDAFPEDPDEWMDSDSDGIGNNEDTDDDNDGMPDAWEEAYGLDPLDNGDASRDADGDGSSNLDEYLAGTDPLQNSNEGIDLIAGWNLISLYFSPDDTAIEVVLSSIAGMYESVWALVDGEWKLYDPASPEFSNLSTMGAGVGYWIKMTEPGFLSMAGGSPSNAVTLAPGWNLVGYNAASSQAMDQAMTSIAGAYQAVWEFNGSEWRLYDPENAGFSNLTALQPGRGYWIQVSEACVWTF